jgi:hypothetical protein
MVVSLPPSLRSCSRVLSHSGYLLGWLCGAALAHYCILNTIQPISKCQWIPVWQQSLLHVFLLPWWSEVSTMALACQKATEPIIMVMPLCFQNCHWSHLHCNPWHRLHISSGFRQRSILWWWMCCSIIMVLQKLQTLRYRQAICRLYSSNRQ